MARTRSRHFFFPEALLADGWCKDVSLKLDAQGTIEAILVNSSPEDAVVVSGPVIPGMPNLHSHAFQRVMAGLSERGSGDDFWGWRETMYRIANQITPEQLKVIATQLYGEMLRAGFTSVAEFHYLHHRPDGRPYDNAAEMSLALLEAAADTGIGITLLPVLYRYSDFDQGAVEPCQRRFASTPDQFLELVDALIVATAQSYLAYTGIALHSLRAVSIEDIKAVTSSVVNLPVHMHISEQMAEVEAAIQHTGLRPVEWLFENLGVDNNWCLVHCTHLIEREINAIADSGAVVGICPITEANLGDGVLPAEELLGKGAKTGIGSDSNIDLDPIAELRLLEYGQRLVQQRRNILTTLADGQNLWQRCALGGAQALAQPVGVLQSGKRADFLVLDKDHPALVSRKCDHIIDSLIFAADRTAIRDVFVAGVKVVDAGMINRQEQRLHAYAEVVAVLS
ncbi:MAG: formimidoylglutamate deiminase [Gammaproteobacteria bacterium]|nr:formimidoylglutamate deiminase [Gammaproteobacteria bacterium]